MKLINSIAAAAVIGGLFLIPVPAEARGWEHFGRISAGNYYIKDMKCRGSICSYDFRINNGNGLDTAKQINCNSWKFRYRIPRTGKWASEWETLSPEGIDNSVAEAYCP